MAYSFILMQVAYFAVKFVDIPIFQLDLDIVGLRSVIEPAQHPKQSDAIDFSINLEHVESWLTTHFKAIFMDFPTKQILIIFDEFLIYVEDPISGCGSGLALGAKEKGSFGPLKSIKH